MGNQSPSWSIWTEFLGFFLVGASLHRMFIDQWQVAGLLLAGSLVCLLVAVRGNTL